MLSPEQVQTAIALAEFYQDGFTPCEDLEKLAKERVGELLTALNTMKETVVGGATHEWGCFFAVPLTQDCHASVYIDHSRRGDCEEAAYIEVGFCKPGATAIAAMEGKITPEGEFTIRTYELNEESGKEDPNEIRYGEEPCAELLVKDWSAYGNLDSPTQ